MLVYITILIDVINVQIKIKKTLKNVKNVEKIKKTFVNV